MSFKSNLIDIVLVETSHPGNIGSVARAMKTMGLTNMSLVNPRKFPSGEANALSGNAGDVLENAKVFNTIEEANSKVLNATANRTKLIEEAGDVLCMLQLMQEHKLFAWEEIEARAVVKKNKLKKWSNLINET